jgi:diketogulonate reductase-like aldo/keto reductase
MPQTITAIDSATELHNGVQMPWLGLGTWQSKDGPQVEQAVKDAIDVGYRSIDTASIYNNETGVGKAVRESGVPRGDLFITTKLWNSDQGYDSTLRAFDASLDRLGMDYVDLYLIHWPVQGKYKDTWRAFETIYNDKRARAIGVSNFMVHHLRDLLDGCDVKPMVNQVEFHPFLVQPWLLNFCREHAIQLQAWSPIMKGHVDEVPELIEIARRHGKRPAQVALRWDLQHGVVTIPKSVHRERIEQNAGVFDFELSDEEMRTIDGLDRNHRFGPDPDHFDF